MEIKELTFEQLEALILTLVKEYDKEGVDSKGKVDIYSKLAQIHMTAIQRKQLANGREAEKWKELQKKAFNCLIDLCQKSG